MQYGEVAMETPMVTRDVLKVLNFQNITRAHKSRNARAGSYDFLYVLKNNRK